MVAEVAFLDDRDERVDVSGIIGAGGKAVFAADTAVFIDDDDAVFPFPCRLNRTIDHARGVLALIAEAGKEVAGKVGIPPFFDNLHPGSKYAQGNAVFGLAGYGATMAADAASEIDQHGISFVGRLLHLSSAQSISFRRFCLSVNRPIF